MLTLELGASNDIEKSVFGDICNYGEKVKLLNDGAPVGIAVFGITDDYSVTLYRIGIIDAERGKKFGDFFSRSMLYKLGLSGLDIVIPFKSSYYNKFGFEEMGDGMRISAEKLTFPSDCKGVNRD